MGNANAAEAVIGIDNSFYIFPKFGKSFPCFYNLIVKALSSVYISAKSTLMEYTIEQYETLKAAVASGVTSVNYGDKTVSYRSLTEMKEILRMMREELFPEAIPRRRRYASVDRGYFPKKRCKY